MYNKWDKDLSDSFLAIEKIKLTILPKLISGKIHSVENQENGLLTLFDVLSGVDYVREDNHGLQGVAARVQWGNAWNTFTIRSKRHTGTKTELEKRIEQIESGYIYPTFTMQAYFDNRQKNNLLSIAIIKTLDLYLFVKNNPDKVYKNKSDNDFIYVKWVDVYNLIKLVDNIGNIDYT